MQSAANAIESLTASDRRTSIERIRDAGKTVVQGLSSLRTHLGGGAASDTDADVGASAGASGGRASAGAGAGAGGAAIGSTMISDENAQVPNTGGTRTGRTTVDSSTPMSNMGGGDGGMRGVGGVSSMPSASASVGAGASAGADVATKLAVSLATERELRATIRQLRSERDAHKRSADRAHAALATARASDEELTELVRLRSEVTRAEADKARLRTDGVSLQRALERARAQKRESDEAAAQERRARGALERVCSKLRARVAAAEEEAKRGAMLDEALRERDWARAATGEAKARADELAAKVAEADALHAVIETERRRADKAERKVKELEDARALARTGASTAKRDRHSHRERDRDLERDERGSSRNRRRDATSGRNGRKEGDSATTRSRVSVHEDFGSMGDTSARWEDGKNVRSRSASVSEGGESGSRSQSRSRSRSSSTSGTRTLTSETETGRDVRTTPMVLALEKLTQALDAQFRESDALKASVAERLRTQHGDTFT